MGLPARWSSQFRKDYIRMKKPGDRVGVALSQKDGVLLLVGYGVYEGDLPVPVDGPEAPEGGTADMVKEVVASGNEFRNPFFRLDDGGYAWGCETWWCTEEQMRKIVAAAKEVVKVDMAQERAKAKKEVPPSPCGDHVPCNECVNAEDCLPQQDKRA
jgi:hypothetical protein